MKREKNNMDLTKREPFKMQYPDRSFYIMPSEKCNPFPWLDPSYKPLKLNLRLAQGLLNDDKDHDKIEYEEEHDETGDISDA